MNRPLRLGAAGAGIVLAVCLTATGATAAPEDAERRAAALAHEIMSPYCPQLLLADCRSEPAVALRAEILHALRRGVGEEAVRDELTQRFGDRILAAPRAAGFGLLAWLTPPLLVCAAALVLIRRIRSAVHAARPPAVEPISDALRARLERELHSI